MPKYSCSGEKSGAPDLIVYRKTAPPDPKSSRIRDVRQELRELKRQWERLEAFLERYFETREGHAKRAYNPFTTADDFESKLETTLRDLLEKRVARGGERIRVPPSTGRQAKPGSPGWLTDEVCLAMVFNRAEIDRR